MTARALALAALQEWRHGRQFADAIIPRLLDESELAGSDRAFATELFYGVLRNLTLLDFWIDQLRPRSLDHDSRQLLRLGLYQLFRLKTPGHAGVFETVALSGRRNRGLINGVLRSALRRQVELEEASAAQPLALRFSHPRFLVERWTATYGEQGAAALFHWNNQPAPIYARINRIRISLENFRLAHPAGQAVPSNEEFIRLTSVPIEAIARGECYIQDPSTATSCQLLDPQPGEVVLDACAAPGGKTGLIAQMMNNTGRLVACDRESSRVQVLSGNLERLGANCAVLKHDWKSGAKHPSLEPSTFDRILLDAPCSNTGVMRRRVDVRFRLTSDDFLRMQHEQLMLLRAIVPLLKPGGTLVYSTCSIEPEENEEVVRQALTEFPFLQLAAAKAVLPFRDGFDGAFAARLEWSR